MIRARCSSQAAHGRPCYYTTLFSVCQEVFEKFFKNFCGIFCRSRSSIRWPLVVSLHIIALLILFVKRFFESFFGLESSAVCHKNVVAKLYILHKDGLYTIKKSPSPEGEGLLKISFLHIRVADGYVLLIYMARRAFIQSSICNSTASFTILQKVGFPLPESIPAT